MRPYKDRDLIAASWLVLGLAAVTGCGTQESLADDRESAVDLGTVSLPLVTETAGHRYRLRNAIINVSGPQFVQLVTSDDPGETALSATLSTGSYYAIIFGWTLEREDDAGNFRPVPATLVSDQAVSFAVFNGTTTTIGYRFRTDGVLVTVGSGRLTVNIGVDEVPPVCTPFASEDGCAAGTWCPPTGLTGAPRACFGAGMTALGLPCLGVMDCVANSACIDLGGGPACTALCASTDFGVPCAAGGTCEPVAADYGVCTPEPAAAP